MDTLGYQGLDTATITSTNISTHAWAVEFTIK